MTDLIVLVADRNAEYLVHGALSRPEALGIRPVTYKVITHPEHDGGARTSGVQLLSVQRGSFRRGLLIFDLEGSGSTVAADVLEQQIDQELSGFWGDSAKSIVISPEVDAWLWGSETHMRAVLDWTFPDGIRDWLTAEGFVFSSSGKPERPKEAFEYACRRARSARSSKNYRAIAERISFPRCVDPAFARLLATCRQWFPNS